MEEKERRPDALYGWTQLKGDLPCADEIQLLYRRNYGKLSPGILEKASSTLSGFKSAIKPFLREGAKWFGFSFSVEGGSVLVLFPASKDVFRHTIEVYTMGSPSVEQCVHLIDPELFNAIERFVPPPQQPEK